ncbi:MAG: pro-sigmaK processing inhibitor BofA family protein [Acutalibacteraceae bacterium]
MILIIGALVVCALTVLIYMKKSGRFIKSLFVSAVQGFAALLAVNAAGTMTGVTLPLNAITLGSSAVFGTPGVIMNLIAQIILLRVHI